jgi:hypothetical protein
VDAAALGQASTPFPDLLGAAFSPVGHARTPLADLEDGRLVKACPLGQDNTPFTDLLGEGVFPEGQLIMPEEDVDGCV